MLDWPVATVLLGTLATLVVGILKWMPRRSDDRNGRVYAHATDLVEIGARLTALEAAHHTLRAEIRADLKELQTVIRESLLRSSQSSVFSRQSPIDD
jgi:methylthioribose-1-phosphate isomerase